MFQMTSGSREEEICGLCSRRAPGMRNLKTNGKFVGKKTPAVWGVHIPPQGTASCNHAQSPGDLRGQIPSVRFRSHCPAGTTRTDNHSDNQDKPGDVGDFSVVCLKLAWSFQSGYYFSWLTSGEIIWYFWDSVSSPSIGGENWKICKIISSQKFWVSSLTSSLYK